MIAMSTSRRAVLVALALPLAGCTNRLAEQAAFAQNALVGMPKQTLLSCAGVPDRSAAIDNVEYFTYSSDRLVSYPGPSAGFYGAHGWPHTALGWGFPMYDVDIQTYSCTATFTLRNGVVERIVYGGSQGGQLGQCYYIVQNCLPQPQPSMPR